MTDIPPPPMPPQPAMPASTPPNNNLVLAILTTVLCCLPLGVVGIVKAAEVNGKWQAGDYAGAQASAEAAKKWSLWGIGIGAAGVLIYLIIVIAGVASSS